MQKFQKIDVCVVTISGETPRGLENIPINNIIIETSKPLGLARMKAIQKVETSLFAFIDDDVIIGESWFKTVLSYMGEKVGAVHGNTVNIGLGEWVTKGFEKHNKNKYKELKRGERGFTTCTLIKTNLVKDWKPSTDEVSSYEDYEITQRAYRLFINDPDTIKSFWKNLRVEDTSVKRY